MAEWLYEKGIGEERAILVEDGTILEARIEVPVALPVGAIVEAVLRQIIRPGQLGVVEIAGCGEALANGLPPRVPEGGRFHVEVMREALTEEGREKRPLVRWTDAPLRAAPTLRMRLSEATELSLYGPDRFEEAGWSELLEEARTGEIAFAGGALRMSLTPAMTLFDVDGTLPPERLAIAGAAAAGQAIRRLAIGGSIGIDLPTVSGKAARQAAAAAIDAVLPQPFERTGVNGFGFLQVLRRRARRSIPELLRADPAGAAARALLRRAERHRGGMILAAAPAVIDRLEVRADWIAELQSRVGGQVALRRDAALSTYAGHVHSLA